MHGPSARAAMRADLLPLALLAPVVAALPALSMGYTREDWLLLWAARAPESAPVRASGAFTRPLAAALWRGSVALGDADPLAMHLMAIALVLMLALAAALLARRLPGAGPWQPLSAAAVVGAHGALVEARLWAAATSGLLAATLAAWAVVLLLAAGWHGRQARARLIAGILLLALSGLARADGYAVLLLLARGCWGTGRSQPPWQRRLPVAMLLAALLVAAAALIWTVKDVGAGWAWHPDHAGRLLRRLVMPWGPPLPKPLASALGLVGVVAISWLGLRHRVGLVGSGLLLIAGTTGGAMLLPWPPAGRYLLLPALGLALVIAYHLVPSAVTRPSQQPQRSAASAASLAALLAWITLGILASWTGPTAQLLVRASRAESSLYGAVMKQPDRVTDRLILVDAPFMGWRGSARDAENVVSAALCRKVVVVLQEASEPRPGRTAALQHVQGDWLWLESGDQERAEPARARKEEGA
jgi:hypothetical protein